MTSKCFNITEGASPQTQIGDALSCLAQTIAARRGADEKSYTLRLLHGEVDAVGKKVVEEAFETAMAAKDLENAQDSAGASRDAANATEPDVDIEAHSSAANDVDAQRDHLRYEAADVVYHLLVLLEREGITLDELAAELNARMDDEALSKRSGIAVLNPEHLNRGK